MCFDHDPGQKNRWNELQGFSHAVSGLVSVSSLAPNPSHACALLSRSNPTLVATQSECVQRVPNNYIEYSKARCFNDLQKLADQGMQPDVVLSSWDDKTLLQRYLERFRVSPHLAHRVWVISARKWDSASMMGAQPVWHPYVAGTLRECAPPSHMFCVLRIPVVPLSQGCPPD